MWAINVPVARQPPWASVARRRGVGAVKAGWQSRGTRSFSNPPTHGDGTAKAESKQQKRKGQVESIVQ